MAALQPLSPRFAATRSIVVGTTSSAAFAMDATAMSVRIVNVGTDTVFFRSSSDGTAASKTSPTADFPIAPNSTEVITKPQDHSQYTLIGVAGGNTVYVHTGEGW